MLRVQLLGEMAVERDGVTTAGAALPGPVARLLAVLALRPGPHAREVLADRFWPDLPPPAGRANLRTAVWALRRAVGPDAVLASRSAVGLDPDGLWVDVVEVRSRAADDDVEGALALCRGELLPGWPEDWAQRAREQHRARHVALLDRVAADAEAAGDAVAAADWSRTRCALTPLDEPAHCALFRRVVAAGDRAGAVLAARDFVDRLRDQLGVAPGPATRTALAQLRGPAPGGGFPDPCGRPPLFGRRQEMRALTAAWEAARRGHGRVVLITGEGGIGKTRLVTELASRADNVGARVAVGAGVDVGGEAPLAMWQELARELVRVVAPPPEAASWPAELGRLSPELSRALQREEVPVPMAAPELERLRIFDAVLRLVEWAAGGRPVLLVAEDVHRADRASMQLCAHVGRRLARLPLLLVVTRRDRPARPEADALLADLAGRGIEVVDIGLGPMSSDELAALARSVARLDEAAVARAVTAAEGSPLLAVESARALAAGSIEPPPSLRAAVRAAVGSLPPSARELVESLAAAGRELSAAEIDALGCDAPHEAECEVLDTGLVRRARGGLRFRHALLAEAARVDLNNPERSHERVGLAIETATGGGGDTTAAEVARHLQRAGRDDLAGPRWQRAGRHARSLGALPEAAGFWAEAVRCDLHAALPRLELAEVQGWLGRPEEFEREWWSALERLPETERSVAWSRRGRIFRTVACHPSASLEAYRRAWELLPLDAARSTRIEILLGLAWGEASLDDPRRAETRLEEVAALAREPDATTTAEIENVRLMVVIRLGRFVDCEAVADRGGDAARRARRPDLGYALHVNAACALSAAGDLAGARRAAEKAVRVTQGITVLEVPCRAALAFVLSRSDRHAEALVLAREQLAMAERMGSAEHTALARHDAGLVALAAGHHQEAAALLAEGLRARARISRPATRLARAEALAGDARPEEATAELRRAAEEPVGPEDQPWALVPRMARVQGLVALARGDRREGERRLAEAATGWRRRRAGDRGAEFMTNFVDLGRPPIVGLVEPERELARLERELAEVAESHHPARNAECVEVT